MSEERTLFRHLVPQDELLLSGLFEALAMSNAKGTFHPHPLDAQTATEICRRQGKDFYGVLSAASEFVGYGMLRGFDEGYVIPSLGMAIHPAFRGRGLGASLMRQLHKTAIEMGATTIRLKVYPDNSAAIKLYQSFGYKFIDEENGQWIGLRRLM